MGSYRRPTDLCEALGALASGAAGADPPAILAGGTDFFPARVGRPADEHILDITALDELRGIADAGDHWRIGALATWSDLIAAPLPASFDALKQAASEVGGAQIQNAGTIAGNVCNASPAADGVPPLLALDAAVELASRESTRLVRLHDFVLGNRRTARRGDELVTALRVPKFAPGSASRFAKLGARRYLVISIVMVAIVIEPDARRQVGRARIAIGACAPTARRVLGLESALLGQRIDNGLGALACAEHLDRAIAPIDDVRGSADYRRDAALTLVRRTLDGLGGAMEQAP